MFITQNMTLIRFTQRSKSQNVLLENNEMKLEHFRCPRIHGTEVRVPTATLTVKLRTVVEYF